MNDKLKCCLCLHESAPDDKVMLYWVGGKGDIARCVNDDACTARQLKARQPRKELAGVR
jgi:hypothetical protein